MLFARSVLFGGASISFPDLGLLSAMPLVLACFIGLFVWIAENVGTATKTWLLPHRLAGWSRVDKLG